MFFITNGKEKLGFADDNVSNVQGNYSMLLLESPHGYIHWVDVVLHTVPTYKTLLPVHPTKLKDLKNRSDKYIHTTYKSFFNNLTATNS